MIGALIGAAVSIGGSILGAVKGANAAKKANAQLAQERADNQNWYDRRYNEDPLSRTAAQRMLTEVGNKVREHNRSAAGSAAVMGASEGTLAAQKQAGSQMVADTAAQIAAGADARRDAVESQYMQNKGTLAEQQRANDMAHAAAIGQASSGLSQAAMSAGLAYDEWRDENGLKKTN